MKKSIVMVLLMVCLMTTACGSDREKTLEKEPFRYETMRLGYDGQPFWEYSGEFVSAENGYYYIDRAYEYSEKYKSFNYLMYFDKETGKAVPLCSKTDCKHTARINNDCDAVFANIPGTKPHYLWYYDGSLYTMIPGWDASHNLTSYDIYKISTDGSIRTKYLTMFMGDCDGFNFYFHRGYVFAVINTGENTEQLMMTRLRNKAEPEVVYEVKGKHSYIGDVQPYDTGIIFAVSDEGGETSESTAGKIVYYDLNTGEVSDIGLDDIPIYYTTFAVVNDDIYYCTDKEIFRYNIKSRETTDLMTLDQDVYLSYDGNYIYGDTCIYDYYNYDFNEHYVYVMDTDGVMIDKIPVPSTQNCYFGDRDYLFQMFDLNEDLSGKAEMAVMKALDKSQIGSGTYEWIDMPLPEAE